MRAAFCLAVFLSATCICLEALEDDNARPTIKTVVRGGDHFEGPHWSARENALYWVDITGQNVHRYDPVTNNYTSRHIDYGPVSVMIPIANATGKLVVGVRTEIYLLNFDAPLEDGDNALRLITALDLGHPDNRINDGKVDGRGRFWVGTIGQEVNEDVVPDQSTLYMITKDNYLNPAVKVRPVSNSNGLAWTKDSKYMFYIDTSTKKVSVFDYDLETGSIRNRRTIFDFVANNITGLPDGMTIDTDDNLWIACFNGGKVLKVDSRSGLLLQEHTMPAMKVSSVSWGGEDMSTLYVTTSQRGLTAQEKAKQPDAGSVFAIEGTGSRGLPANEFLFDPDF